MARTASQLSADRIRIEDEVWENAFSTRESPRPRRGSQTTATVHLLGGDARSRPARPATRGSARAVGVAEASPLGLAEPAHTVTLAPAPEGRRTVRIEGRGSERNLHFAPARNQRMGFSPDRLAMWAVLLGFLLVLVAMLSSQF
jgi:hypothetical protein